MNVRLDYRHIHYWQQTLGRPDHVLSSSEGGRLHRSTVAGEVRPEAPNPLQERAPTVREKSLRYPRR
jgi:hypothetical protein